jgi:hypothetical protein
MSNAPKISIILVEIRLCSDKTGVVYTDCGLDPRLLKIGCPDKVYFP